ncbi:MAG TPA: glycerophosphodiester phosphodiesterase family protein [Myxococcaceae bacterium]|nr:glycerophosphodiester phosphodiesterase family protein [Myxococcaceae bacterium]
MQILGHRGASALAPENTLEAFELAWREGADGVELDAMACSTGEVVVCHDEELTRLAGVAREVRRSSWQWLRTLDVGSRLGFAPARIPLLEEVLEALPDHLMVNVELKCERVDDGGLCESAVRLVQRMGQTDRVRFSSFYPPNLVRVAELAPDMERALLLDPDRAFLLQDAVFAPLFAKGAIHPFRDQVTAARMRAWRRRGLQVRVWTVNDVAQAARLRALGVSAILTDDPGRLRRELGQR